MKRYVLLCLILTGCMTNSGGQQFSTDAARQVHVGTPKSTVQTLLGAPLTRSLVNGEETWTYTYVESNTSVSPVSFVPYVNLVAGGATNASVSKIISIRFRGENVARCSIKLSTQNTSMSGGPLGGYRQDGGQTQTFENDCDKQ
jgi:outer membrane protein assembly factor BamE (lipoprotein component of BamABCDE complex)